MTHDDRLKPEYDGDVDGDIDCAGDAAPGSRGDASATTTGVCASSRMFPAVSISISLRFLTRMPCAATREMTTMEM